MNNKKDLQRFHRAIKSCNKFQFEGIVKKLIQKGYSSEELSDVLTDFVLDAKDDRIVEFVKQATGVDYSFIWEKAKTTLVGELSNDGFELGKDFSFYDGGVAFSPEALEHLTKDMNKEQKQQIEQYINDREVGATKPKGLEHDMNHPFWKRLCDRIMIYAKEHSKFETIDYLVTMDMGMVTRHPHLEPLPLYLHLISQRDKALAEELADAFKFLVSLPEEEVENIVGESIDRQGDVMTDLILAVQGNDDGIKSVINEDGKKDTLMTSDAFRNLDKVWWGENMRPAQFAHMVEQQIAKDKD